RIRRHTRFSRDWSSDVYSSDLQPVRLVDAVFPQQRGSAEVGYAVIRGDGYITRVIDTLELLLLVEPVGQVEDLPVAFRRGADDQLGALAGGHELGGAANRLAFIGQAGVFVGEVIHGRDDVAVVLFRRDFLQAPLGGQLDIHTQAVGIEPGLMEQLGTGPGDGLDMDVAVEVVLGAQRLGDAHQLFHGRIGALEDARAEKQPFDEVAPVEIQRQRDDFLHGEAGALHVVTAPGHAVGAVVHADVGKQDLQQRDAAPIFGIAVTDAVAVGVVDALVLVRPLAAAR